jgi:hypothetical protein
MSDNASLLVVVAGTGGERADPAYVVVTHRETGIARHAAVADGMAMVPDVAPGYHEVVVPASRHHLGSSFLVHAPAAEWLTACDLVVPTRDGAAQPAA